jgi:hypothetical protein
MQPQRMFRQGVRIKGKMDAVRRRKGRKDKHNPAKRKSKEADYDEELHDFLHDIEYSAKKILKNDMQSRKAESIR